MDSVNNWTWLKDSLAGLEPRLVILIAVPLGVLIVSLAVRAVLRRRAAKRGGNPSLDSPTAILEEVRLRLENLPVLPQLATPIDVELSLENPFDEPLPSRRQSPPLPTDAVDPATGEPDQEAYRVWLKEWLLFAEQYGDETTTDPSRTDGAGEQAYQ